MALQYAATEGLASVRDYVSGRLAAQEGQAPGAGELMITSGGIDCMELLAKSYVDPGDVVVVEAPTYLGGIMAFRGYEADVHGVPVDDGGLRVDVLADQLAGGLRPKILYTIPDYQNPTGLSLSAERRAGLVALARRYGFLILRGRAVLFQRVICLLPYQVPNQQLPRLFNGLAGRSVPQMSSKVTESGKVSKSGSELNY